MLVGGLVLAAAGCGGMRPAELRDEPSTPASPPPAGTRVPVAVGRVTAASDAVPAELRDPVCRYLLDIAKAELAGSGVFALVETNAAPDLLAGFGVQPDPAASPATSPEAVVDVEVLRVEEKLGATVKVALASSQQKHAIARVRVSVRRSSGGGTLAAEGEGRSSKGAWGILATVNREAMKGGQAEWKLDGSMAGVACAEALRAAIGDLEKQVRFRTRTLGTGVEERFLKPRTEGIR